MKVKYEKYLSYTVSSIGEVWNKEGKKMKPYVHASRGIFYLRYSLAGKKIFAHKLVAKLFIVNEFTSQVDHIDGNPFNNHIKNLELVSGKKNMCKRRKYLEYKKQG